MRGFTDPGRAVLCVTGADARGFLQDLVTNDVAKVRPGSLVYAALLSPQGKYLFDFLLTEAPEGGLLIDISAGRAAGFAQRLTLYRLRRDVAIEATDLPVSLIWGTDAPPEGALPDPRDARLGWRLYGPLPDAVQGDPAEYEALRITALVPETGAELLENDSYILEQGFERLSGVDFRKGCYVGQEVTARMKHKTELKKGLVKVRIEGDAVPGTPVEVDGKPAGTLHSVVGTIGLAHLRFDRAEGEMLAGAARLWRAE